MGVARRGANGVAVRRGRCDRQAMPSSPRPAPLARFHSLRRPPLGLAVACATLALSWPHTGFAQDGSASIDKRQTDPLGPQSGEQMPPPQLGQPAAPAPAGEETIGFEADRVEYATDAELVTASGNVLLVRDGQSVRADTVTWNRSTGQIV